MTEKLKKALQWAAPVVVRVGKSVGRILAVYLDDLLLLASGTCLTMSAADFGGRAAGLAAAGVCLAVYAVAVARARRTGGR